jgi:hypothetical protein
MATEPTPLGTLIRAAYGPQIEATYGMTFDEFGDYVKESGGELPPLKDGLFAGMPACWPHLHCSHD